MQKISDQFQILSFERCLDATGHFNIFLRVVLYGLAMQQPLEPPRGTRLFR